MNNCKKGQKDKRTQGPKDIRKKDKKDQKTKGQHISQNNL